MRVISGIYGSRSLNAPNGRNTRPTLDNVKEAMFNIVNFYVSNSVCLDLFSGSGGLGIECISRGAKKVIFNDLDIDAYNTIKSNIESLDIDKNKYELYNLDYKKCIEKIDTKLNIVLLDPPYKEKIYEDVIIELKNKALLSDRCVIVCECDLKQSIFDIEGFKSKEYKYGNKKLIILK